MTSQEFKRQLSLNVLDQSPIPEGLTASDALHNSIDLARHTDSLGYQRYWVAEHHGTPGLACNSPEVLIGPIAAASSRIRVGSGGVMLPHYSPLKVAESFGMLSALYPGRIDLGIGRAAGTSRNVAIALQRDRRQPAPDDFPEQLDELLAYFEGGSPSLGVAGSFTPSTSPEPWLLGSSLQSAIWAAELGLPYVFADFINSDGLQIAAHYHRAFKPSSYLTKPWMAVAAWAICAETDAEAYRLSLSARMMLAMMFRGRLIAVPTVERAQRFFEEERAAPDMLTPGRRFITGSPARVRASVETLARDYQAGEVFLVNILHSHFARLRSYELIAEAFDLQESSKAQRSATA